MSVASCQTNILGLDNVRILRQQKADVDAHGRCHLRQARVCMNALCDGIQSIRALFDPYDTRFKLTCVNIVIIKFKSDIFSKQCLRMRQGQRDKNTTFLLACVFGTVPPTIVTSTIFGLMSGLVTSTYTKTKHEDQHTMNSGAISMTHVCAQAFYGPPR